jgi:flagellar biosynthesis/type III secretory pathway protein FliH
MVGKFPFHLCFDTIPLEEKEPEVITYSEDDLKAEKAAGFAEGFEQGQQEALTGVQQKLVQVQERISENLEIIHQEQTSFLHSFKNSALLIGRAVAEKLTIATLRKESVAQVEAVLKDIISKLEKTTEIKITVHPSIQKHIQEKISSFVIGKKILITLEEDASLFESDCKVSWDHGGMERLLTDVIRNIDNVVNQYLKKDATIS